MRSYSKLLFLTELWSCLSCLWCRTKIAYGRIQRRLGAKYGVALIPKRYFAQVLGDASAPARDAWRLG
jgi:hypothetical protein